MSSVGDVVSEDNHPKTYNIWPSGAPTGNTETENVAVNICVHQTGFPKSPAVVICPGGGYGSLVMEGEGHSIARWLNTHGITGVVLEYRLPAGRWMVPLLDLQQAIRVARANAETWDIDPKRVGVIGFSAGGHLASTAATHFDYGHSDSTDVVARQSSRPDFAILIYPVVTMDLKTHSRTKENLIGANPDESLVQYFSNEKHVNSDTPPTFLAHAVDDTAVHPDNSRNFYRALTGCGVPAEYVELPDGGHGLNGYSGKSWDTWQERSIRWLRTQGFII